MISSVDLKSLRLLWAILAKSHRYSVFVRERDILEFERRALNEGLDFLTTALPTLGKALDAFHSTTEWNSPSGFETGEDGIPLFLGDAVRLALRGSSLAVDCVRQLTFMFYKLEVDYDKAIVSETLEKFEETDRDILGEVSRIGASESVQSHLTSMKRIICRVLDNTNPWDIRPCHGSGATACRTKNEDKWHKLRYFPKLDETYPYADYFFYNFTHLSDEMEKLENSLISVPRARVCLVPKDSRGPRIISCEPAELMFIQQGLMRLLYEVIENHPLTRSQINFRDQSINQSLAKSSSVDGTLATLDLNEASDRLSLYLVQRVFPSEWIQCLQACRSEETVLPSGKIVKLNKFAPMGSACCFPVEALVFWASCQATMKRLGVIAKSFVYGDDIIIPVELVDEVCYDLVSIGLKINATKSYTKGPFRESCGGDFHLGESVTPVRVRKILGKSHTGLSTAADLCNEIIAKFGNGDAEAAIELIESKLGYTFPRSVLRIPNVVQGVCNGNDAHFQRRWNKSLQRFEHRILQLTTRVLSRREPTWSELLRKELTVESRRQSADNKLEDSFLLHQLFARDGIQLVEVSEPGLEPGQYADNHTAHNVWRWVWLG